MTAAARPETERRLHTEIDSVLGGRPATYADIPRLEFTGRVITETLRMYPPGWFFTRTVTTPTRLGKHALPDGATLLYSPYLIHHRGDLYDSPTMFNPDRWDPRHSPQPSRNTFIPFGAGPRTCIGDTFAMTEATLALAAIAARWHLDPLPGQNARPRLAGVLWPRQSRMRAVARKEHRA
jgi:cytochrome P450